MSEVIRASALDSGVVNSISSFFYLHQQGKMERKFVQEIVH